MMCSSNTTQVTFIFVNNSNSLTIIRNVNIIGKFQTSNMYVIRENQSSMLAWSWDH